MSIYETTVLVLLTLILATIIYSFHTEPVRRKTAIFYGVLFLVIAIAASLLLFTILK